MTVLKHVAGSPSGWFFLILVWLLLSLCTLYFFTFNNFVVRKHYRNTFPLSNTVIRSNMNTQSYIEWPKFSLPLNKVKHSCLNLSSNDVNIERFVLEIEKLRESDRLECRRFLEDFNLIFEVTHRYSRHIHFPAPFEKKIKKSFNDSRLSDNLNHQNLIHVFNRLTFEHNIYNPLRAKRPKPLMTEDIWNYVDKISVETGKKCDMCLYLQQTAVDELGRHQTEDTVRVSNAFKIERWHGMVITRHTHHPTNFTLKEVIMMFKDATDWAAEIQVKDCSYIYPHLAWDVLFKAGASQIHPHVHVVLAPTHYYGPMEQLKSVAERYFQTTGENYFGKLVEIYSGLSLAFWYGSSVAMSTLTGKGDLEVLLLSEEPSLDLYTLLYFVVKTYHQMRIPCHSASMSWAPSDDSEHEAKGRIPALIRIMSRGDCLSKQNDVSSLDLFLINYREHDPWEFLRLFKQVVPKYEAEAYSALEILARHPESSEISVKLV